MLLSREERERRQRQRAKKSRSQLLGPVAQGGRRPMQQGYTTTKVEPPKFRESTIGADITQAGLAFKGGKGLREFATGTEGGYNKAGVWVEGKEPWSLGGKSISDRLSQYGTDVGNRFGETKQTLSGLLGTGDSGISQVGNIPRTNMTSEVLGQLQPSATPNINIGGYGAGTGAGEGIVDVSGQRIRGPSLTQLGDPSAVAKKAVEAQRLGMGSQNLLNASATGGSNLSSSALGAYPGNQYNSQIKPSLLSSGSLPSQAGNVYAPAGTYGTTGGSTLHQGGGSLSGTSTVGGEAAASGAGGSGHPWLAYANIGKDLFMGGPGSQKITGSTAGDAVIRAAAAYYTFGFSELAYGLF